MKTFRNLYPQIISSENLLRAWRNARRGKRYQPTVAAFEQHLDEELTTLQRELQDETYQPGGYRSFTIHEPKRRKISAAPFRDRLVHHALCQVIQPIYERKFIFDSYANRKGKGTHSALNRCTQWMRRYRYVMHCDVQEFFPAIDHTVLKGILNRTIVCESTRRLYHHIIDSGAGILTDQYTMRYFPGDDLFAAQLERGLPIGNLTSQFWANVYLNELDQFVKHRLRATGYLRYVDDVLLFANDKVTLHDWRDAIITFLQSLRLTLHEQRAQPRLVEQGITFLGFVVFPTHRRLKRSSGMAYRRRLRTLYAGYQAGEIDREALNASVQAWIGHVRHGDTWGLRRVMLRDVVL